METSSQVNAENVMPLKGINRSESTAKVSQAVVLIEMFTTILNARILAVMALVGALAIWIYTTYDPSALRLWSACGYSIGVLCPIIVLYAKKGDQ